MVNPTHQVITCALMIACISNNAAGSSRFQIFRANMRAPCILNFSSRRC